MAINKVVNKSTKSHGAMRNVLEYVLRDEKVKDGFVELTGPHASDTVNYAIRSAVIGVSGNDKKVLTEDQNIVFRSYIYENSAGNRVYRSIAGYFGKLHGYRYHAGGQ